jgi:O-antigen/teichoic acid export membrane protein
MFKKLFNYAPVQVFSALSVFLLIAIQTRFLTIAEYGLLALVLVFMETTRAFVAQWINSSLIRLLPAESKQGKKELLALSFRLLLFLIVPGSISLALCLLFSGELSIALWMALSLLLISKSFFLYFQELFRLTDNVKKYRYSVLLQAFLSVILTLLLLSWSSSIVVALFALVLSNLIPCLLSYNLLLCIRTKVSSDKKSQFITYGLPLMFSGILTVLSTRVDRVVISELLGLDAIGMYAAFSNMLIGVLALVFMIIALPLYPELTKHADCKASLYKAHKNYLNMILLITVPATVGIALVASPLIEILLGANYKDMDVSLFYWVTLSIFFMNFKAHFIDHGLQFTLKTKVLSYISLIALILNIILSYLFIHFYGLSGAGYAFALTQVVCLLLSYVSAKKYGYCYPVPANLFEIIFATTLMAVTVFILNSYLTSISVLMSLFISIFAGVSVYIITHLILNTMNCRSYIVKVKPQ